MCKIIHYKKDYYNVLLEYFLKVNPDYTKDYFDYFINQIPLCYEDVCENLLVLNDDGDVVGCHFYFPTKALIQGVEHKIFWGHDTFLDEKYRKEFGCEFMLSQKPNGYSFGAGLSLTNYKIQKRIKASFLGVFKNYVIINWKTPISIFLSKLFDKKRKDLSVANVIVANNIMFERIDDIDKINIKHNGYWFCKDSDIEFVRDKHFIDNRLLRNFNKYYVFVHNSSEGITKAYFAVRIIHRKQIPVLSIVDFRYDMNDKMILPSILKAANKIASTNNIPFTLLTTTMQLDKSLYTFKLKESPCAVIVGPKSIKYNNIESIVFTKADSDADFEDI